MSEDPSPPKSITEWIQTKIGAGLLTLVSALGLSLATIAREKLSAEHIVLVVAIPTAALVLLAWIFVVVASRQRSTISKLEKDVESLKSDLSSLRNAPSLVELQRRTDTEDKLMIFIIGAKGKTLPQIAAHLGMSETRTEVILSALAKDLFVYRQGYTEGPAHWCLGDAGKRYLADNDLIQ